MKEKTNRLALKPIHEQIIVITGAASDIGSATALLAARSGAKLVIASAEEEPLQRLYQEIKKGETEIMYVVADESKEEDTIRIAQSAVRTFGTFDTWVNSSGIDTVSSAPQDISTHGMRNTFEKNFWSVVYGSRIAMEHLKRHGGSIISIGEFGTPSQSAEPFYTISKHATQEWVHSLQGEMQAHDIPVSLSYVQPSKTNSSKNKRSLTSTSTGVNAMVHTPESVARAILHCAEHPIGNLVLGAQSRFVSILEGISHKVLHPSPSTKDETNPSATSAPSQTTDEQNGSPRSKRIVGLYANASKRPMLSSIVLAGLGAGMWLLSRRTKQKE